MGNPDYGIGFVTGDGDVGKEAPRPAARESRILDGQVSTGHLLGGLLVIFENEYSFYCIFPCLLCKLISCHLSTFIIFGARLSP